MVQTSHNYSIQVSCDQYDARWDQFVASCRGGHHEQTSLWVQFKFNYYGWEPIRIIVSRNGVIYGGVQILKRRLKWFGNIGYVTRGPLSISEDPELLNVIVAALDNAAKHARLKYLAVIPSYTGHHFVPLLEKLNFMPKPDFLPPSAVMRATLVLDLAEDIDKLMERMRRNLQRDLRRALSSGLVFREGAENDIETFRRLMWALCERRGCAPSPPQKDFFHNLWKMLHAHGHLKLFLVEFDKTPVSAVITFPFGDTVRLWKIGWNGEHEKLRPNALLYWEVIKWSKQNGYRYFDFVWIDLESANKLHRGEAIQPDNTNGMSFFKIGFGGQVILLPEQYLKFYNRLVQLLFRFGGRQLLASKWGTGIIRRIYHSNASADAG